MINEAPKLDKAEIEASALAVGGVVEASRHAPVGNSAAMREALVAIRDAARNFYHQILNSKYSDIMDKYKCRERGFPALLDLRYAIPKANAAISAPPRNCDVGTAEEQFERYQNFCRRHYYSCGCARCPANKTRMHGTSNCDLAWAQESYVAESEVAE